jgi:hypothetical protein
MRFAFKYREYEKEEAAEDQKSKIYVRVFVVLLCVYSQWGLERTQPTPTGRKTARMVSN